VQLGHGNWTVKRKEEVSGKKNKVKAYKADACSHKGQGNVVVCYYKGHSIRK
jgi:hypothetical protein